MAKGNLLLGMGQGSIGDITLYRRSGKQISRARARQVKNPKSEAQRVQRVILATAAKAYSAAKAICNHSYQGVSYGADSQAKFLSLNLDMLRNRLAANGLTNDDYPNYTFFVGAGLAHNGIVPNPWAISRGILPELILDPVGGLQSETSNAVELADLPDGAATMTYKELADALGLQIGDQITLCAVDFSGRFDYGRFVIASNDGDENAVITDDTKWNPRNQNSTIAYQNDKATMAISTMENQDRYMTCFGVIVSRRDGDNWQRSNCNMRLMDVDFGGTGYSMEDALANVDSSIDFASPYYLNNANRPTTAEEGGDENP